MALTTGTNSMPQGRTIASSPVDTAETRVIADLLGDRFSCRGYRPDPVPHEVIERLLALSQLTASWCNSQPWQVIVTEGQGTERFRQALFDHASRAGLEAEAQSDFPYPVRYAGIYKDRRRECGWQLYECVGVSFGDREASARQSLENFRFFGAPHVAIVTSEDDLGVYGAIDCGAYVGNFLLIAESLGISAIPQAALAHHSPFVRQYFGVPENRRIVCGMSFGYADPDHPANQFRTKRAPLDEVVTWITD